MSTLDKLAATKEVIDAMVAAGRISVLDWMYIIDEELPDDEITVYVAIEGEDQPREAFYQAGAWLSALEPHTLHGVYAWAHIPELPPVPAPVVLDEEDDA